MERRGTAPHLADERERVAKSEEVHHRVRPVYELRAQLEQVEVSADVARPEKVALVVDRSSGQHSLLPNVMRESVSHFTTLDPVQSLPSWICGMPKTVRPRLRSSLVSPFWFFGVIAFGST